MSAASAVACCAVPFDLRQCTTCSVADRLGWAAVAGFTVILYPVPRNSFLQKLFHTDFSRLIRYHRRALQLLCPVLLLL